VGVKALIVNDEGNILLMKEDGSAHRTPVSDYWDFPGGRIQENETATEALYREIEEETGITELEGSKFYTAAVSNHAIPLKSGITVGLILMVYRVKIKPQAKIELSDEHLGYEWVSLTEAKRRLLDKYPKEFTQAL
jgi:mutator protein MutT